MLSNVTSPHSGGNLYLFGQRGYGVDGIPWLVSKISDELNLNRLPSPEWRRRLGTPLSDFLGIRDDRLRLTQLLNIDVITGRQDAPRTG